jgi:hypothetical protein
MCDKLIGEGRYADVALILDRVVFLYGTAEHTKGEECLWRNSEEAKEDTAG